MEPKRFFRTLSCMVFLLMTVGVRAQDQTFSIQKSSFGQETGSMLLIPWEGKMFLSDINKEVHNHTGLELDEIKRLFREGFCQLFTQQASANWEVVDLVTDGDEGKLQDLEYTHQSIAYSFTKLLPPEPESKVESVLGKLNFRKEKEQEGRGVGVKEGQLDTYYDENERFMSTRIINPELLEYLQSRYEFDVVVFINELDIKVMRDHNIEHGQQWDRRIKIHYSVYDKSGMEITSNAAFAEYAGSEKDIYGIIRKNFSTPASFILSDIDAGLKQLIEAGKLESQQDDY